MAWKDVEKIIQKGGYMRVKLLSILLVLFVLSGCTMDIVKKVNKWDSEGLNAAKEFARGRLKAWSYNAGFMDGFGLLKDGSLSFPVRLENENEVRAFIQSSPTLLGISDMNTLAKKKYCKDKEEMVSCWTEEDYDLGRANGLYARVVLRGSLELASIFINQFAPELAEYLVPILKFLVI